MMNTATFNSITRDTYYDTENTRSHSNFRSTALIWVKGLHDKSAQQRVVTDIEKMDGVLSAKILRDKPAMLQVEYIPEEQQLVNVVRMISKSGNHASRVC